MGSEVAGSGKDSQQTERKTKNPIVRKGNLFCQSNHPVQVQEIDKRVPLGCESTSERTKRLVSSCVPVSVERLDQDKDADENVDADHVRTERPVEGEQSLGLFTQREEKDTDFRVSGLPNTVVK